MSTPRIPLMRSTFFDEERTREKLAAFIKTAPRLSMGPACAAFENAFSVYQERSYAVLVSNGSAANLGLLQALLNLGRLKPGDRVGISAVTWATNVMPVMQLGLIPVPVDCELSHLNVSAATLQPVIASLQALFLTNVLGFCGDIDAIATLCERNNVILLEDNCESLGTRHDGTLLGNFGVASTFSFFVGHHLSTIEGGMICTDDEELHEMLVMVRAHGWDRNLPEARQQELREEHGIDDFNARYTFYVPAYNLRCTEIAGYLGSLQLPMLEETILRRERNYDLFSKVVSTRPDLYMPLDTSHIERVSNFAMPVITHSASIHASAIERFTAAGVEIRPVIAGDITQHPFWKERLPAASCPNAALIHAQGFYFPNNADLSDEDVDLLCHLLTQS